MPSSNGKDLQTETGNKSTILSSTAGVFIAMLALSTWYFEVYCGLF